jgi:beta-glucanase (GH16 family)
VLSFDARATQARAIIAGIGLNYAPWYANIEEVALTTNWNTFELTLDAIDDGTGAAFGDANNRIIFDLGAAVGTVHLDNVSLRKVLTGSEGGNVSTPGLDGYTLVWSDEFDAAELDNAAWTPLLGDGSDFGIPGWGNNELQNYTAEPENVSLGVDEDNTVLKITALEDGSGGYTSARLTTAGKVSVRYGKIVGRMKLPETQGFWPAFWLLGDANEVFWPGIGEIDIMELIGHEPEKTHHTVHFVNENQQYNFIGQDFVNSEKFSEGYNDFMIDWTPEYITWYVNDEQAFQLPIRDYMKEFQRPFHIILNVAVGGNWPGSPDDTSVFPQTMYVDYVRVYEKDGFIPDAPPPVDACEETIGCSGSAGSADISQAILTGFDDFGPDLGLLRFGAGGEPSYSNSDDAIDGAQSVQFSYPGGAFGGSWITLTQPRDLSAYAASDLVFAIKKPAVVADLEVKLESNGGGAGSMFLVDYSSTDLGNGWEEYRIPLADFVAAGLVLEELTIPFALWNPVDTNGDFPAADILFDAIRFE